jgi:GABA permease
MISIGGIIGAGIFVGSGAAIEVAGPGVLVSYALCGLLIFVIMRMLGEMAVARPGVGSFAGYAALALGSWAGFVSGWLYCYFWVVTIAIEAIAGAKIMGLVVPVPMWLGAAALILLMALVNLLSVRVYGEFEFWFAALKLATIVGFIGVGLGWIVLAGPGVAGAWHHVVAHGGVFPMGWQSVFTAVPVVIFSMMGSEVATIAAAETDDPAGNVVRAGRTVSLRILVFYVGAVGVIVAILPWNLVVPGLSPFTQALTRINFPAAGLLMTVVVFTAIVSCLNSAIYITSRMLFELAGRGDAPARLGLVTSRRVPRAAILAGCGLGLVVAMGSVVSPGRIFVFLLQSSGAIILLVYLLIVLAEMALRRQLEAAGAVLTVRVWAFPYASLAAAGGILGVLALMAATPGLRVQVGLGLLGFAVAWLAWRLRRVPAPV